MTTLFDRDYFNSNMAALRATADRILAQLGQIADGECADPCGCGDGGEVDAHDRACPWELALDLAETVVDQLNAV